MKKLFLLILTIVSLNALAQQETITYQDKSNPVPITNRSQQATAEDFNEIKDVVNNNAADATQQFSDIQDSLAKKLNAEDTNYFSGDYNDLTNQPTNLSDFNNDLFPLDTLSVSDSIKIGDTWFTVEDLSGNLKAYVFEDVLDFNGTTEINISNYSDGSWEVPDTGSLSFGLYLFQDSGFPSGSSAPTLFTCQDKLGSTSSGYVVLDGNSLVFALFGGVNEVFVDITGLDNLYLDVEIEWTSVTNVTVKINEEEVSITKGGHAGSYPTDNPVFGYGLGYLNNATIFDINVFGNHKYNGFPNSNTTEGWVDLIGDSDGTISGALATTNIETNRIDTSRILWLREFVINRLEEFNEGTIFDSIYDVSSDTWVKNLGSIPKGDSSTITYSLDTLLVDSSLVFYDSTRDALTIKTKLGNFITVGDEMSRKVHNVSGTDINNCDPVYVYASGEDVQRVSIASNLNPTAYDFLGLATTDIPNGEFGMVTYVGATHECPTDIWEETDELYLGNGALQNTIPTSGHIIKVGQVDRKHLTEGIITVSVQYYSMPTIAALKNDGSDGTYIDSTSVTTDSSIVNTYLDVNGNADLNGILFTGSTKTAGAEYTGTTNPTNTNRKNYDGYFHSTALYADGGLLDVAGTQIQAAGLLFDGANRPSVLNEVATATNPIFIINENTQTTGIGGTNTYISSIISGSEMMRVSQNSTNINGLTTSDSLKVGDGETVTGTVNGYTAIQEHTFDSLKYTNPISKWHRVDSINTSQASTWVNVKWTLNVADETTYGVEILPDSTGFTFTTSGVFRVSGCGHASANTSTTIETGIRGTTDGVESRCIQSNWIRSNIANDQFIMPYGGTIRVVPGTIFRIQYYVSSIGMDFEGPDIFDNPIAFSVNFEKISE